MTLSDLLFALPPRRALAIAIGLSIVVYALASNMAWVNDHQLSARLSRFASRQQSKWPAVVLKEGLRWLYYIGTPYTTLILGYNTVRALGVWNLDWFDSLAWMAAIGLGATFVLTWVWRPYARTEHVAAVDESKWNWARHIIELIYQQAHWAFYRSGPILWLGDVYWGSFLGLGLSLLEGWSNPNVRSSLRDTARADAPLWTGSIAIITTVLFIYTQNLYYCLAIHLFLDQGLRVVIGFPRATAAEPAPPLDADSE
ncbi:MAG: hypothetical protein M1570_05290 [Chloroflexi bacterium]|nr:hypothetical protein [Chloroflexota bacterium]